MDWIDLGTFHAEDERRVRHFPLETHVYAKYIKVGVVSSVNVWYVVMVVKLPGIVHVHCIRSFSLFLSVSLSLSPPPSRLRCCPTMVMSITVP